VPGAQREPEHNPGRYELQPEGACQFQSIGLDGLQKNTALLAPRALTQASQFSSGRAAPAKVHGRSLSASDGQREMLVWDLDSKASNKNKKPLRQD